jgi:hypothetical protein
MSALRSAAFLAIPFVPRAVTLWVCARLLAVVALAFATQPPLPRNASTAVYMTLVAVALGFVDVHRRHEQALLGNLGIGKPTFALWCAIPAILGELALILLLGGT